MSTALQLATQLIHSLKFYGNVVLLTPEMAEQIATFKALVPLEVSPGR